MCGICGLVDLRENKVSSETLVRMSDCLTHRGPDAKGYWLEDNVGFGHTRLAILDLTSAANQPMTANNDRYALTYNGEVFNYKELKVKLEAKGYQFRTQSDTEVVLNSLIEWGAQALHEFNGMFALGFFDKVQKRLIIARDRCGIKPLYYFENDGHFVFASEQKSILQLSGFSKSLDLETLYEYMTFQNIFTNKTFVQGIKLLPAGHYIEIWLNKSSERNPKRYWDFLFDEIDEKSEDEYLEEFKEIFERSIRSQMIADVEIGAYLSGGIDSASISAFASQIKPIKTFTVGFSDHQNVDESVAYDERSNASAISKAIGTKHFEYILEATDIESSLVSLVNSLEEPRIGQSYPNFYAAKLASEHVKVVLSGAGGDELFGGYPWRYFQGKETQSFSEYVDQYYLYWQRLLPNSELRRLFSPVWGNVSHVWTRDIFEEVFNNHSKRPQTQNDFVNNALYFEAKTFLHSLLILEDKISMGFGLESRIPFLDNEMVAFASRLPVKYKIKNLTSQYRIDESATTKKRKEYFSRTSDGKLIVRKALPNLVPDSVRRDVKRGFTSPDLLWFRNENRNFIENKVLDRTNNMYSVFDFNVTKVQVEKYFEGSSNNRLLIWSLLYLSILLETF
jgi:asparagine synthase (glutamine-hydrolysing)